MKTVAIALVLVCGSVAAFLADAGPPMHTVRVLTYNIHHGEGMDGEWNLPRLAGIIGDAKADLVALQEVDEATERSGGVFQIEELGRLTGLHPTFGRAIDYRGGEYGVGILSRWTPVSVENRPLPGTDESEPRTALTVSLEPWPQGPRLSFTSTHFEQGRDEESRLAQAIAINERLGSDSELRILGGDLNSNSNGDVVRIVRTRWTDVSPTDPSGVNAAGRPVFRADYIFVRPAERWQVIAARVVDAPLASDHLPILAVLAYR